MKRIQKQQINLTEKNNRTAVRFTTELPVEMAGMDGLIRNVSARGLYFEIESKCAPDSQIQLTVEIMAQGKKSKLICNGKVIRVAHKNGKLGVAVVLERSFFAEAVDVIDIAPCFLLEKH